jgi:hypothetical protein
MAPDTANKRQVTMVLDTANKLRLKPSVNGHENLF